MNEAEMAEYARTVRVPVYAVGPDDRLKFGSVLRLVQETSEQHLGVMGAGYEEMRRRTNLVFFIISTRVRLGRLPLHGERVVIKTHPRGRAGAQFYRDFLFYGEGGELLVSVMQTTVLVEAGTRRIQRPQALREFGIRPGAVVPPQERMERLEAPQGLPPAGERRVFRSDLDANGHMNNCVYGDIVSDFLPAELRPAVRGVQIHYLSETPEGDVLRIFAGKRDGAFLMRGENARGVSFAARVRTGKKRAE